MALTTSVTTKQQRFALLFDKFFDCLNMRHPIKWIEKKKSFRKPHKSADERFTVSLNADTYSVVMCSSSTVATARVSGVSI